MAKVYKFGGSSLAAPEAIMRAVDLIRSGTGDGELLVVASAFGGVTDGLLQMADLALDRDEEQWRQSLAELDERHTRVVEQLLSGDNRADALGQVKRAIGELEDVLHGVTLIRELTPRTKDFIQSFGERLSAYILSRVLVEQRVQAHYLDARKVIRTDDRFGRAHVDMRVTGRQLRSYLSNSNGVQVITGFIGATENDETTTLGRGGSDYTASIVASLVGAEELVIWTDVDGVLTADPRKVRRAFPVAEMTYEEAMEMSHFGARVIYPPTLQPLINQQVPLRIRNTFRPDAPGTRVGPTSNKREQPIKGLTSIDDVAVIRIQGSGMVGVAGIAARIFGALADEEINVILISQASSEHSVCLAVLPEAAEASARALRREFREELRLDLITFVEVETGYTVLAVVGENMRLTPGIAGKVFNTLGRNGINVVAIAQGSSELNISAIIDRKNESKALTALHDAFFLSESKAVHLFQIGVGTVGGELLRKIGLQEQVLRDECNVEMRLAGVAHRRKMLLDPQGIDLSSWEERLEAEGEPMDLDRFMGAMHTFNLANSIFIDATADEELPDRYPDVLEDSISIVTPNKKANARNMDYYRRLRALALRYNAKFLYETNVGAGLPVIETMRHMVIAGDRVRTIEAVLSGTLSYIFNVFDGSVPFSEVVQDAQRRGFTEPDPRDDLNGMDVGRKLLILAREAGWDIELGDIEIENLVPKEARASSSVDDFYQKLKQHDDFFAEKHREAAAEGKRLRYIARFENGTGYTRLESAGPDHPFYGIEMADNLVVLTTDQYLSRPLVIRGPGAGAEVTAGGVLSDILKITRYGE